MKIVLTIDLAGGYESSGLEETGACWCEIDCDLALPPRQAALEAEERRRGASPRSPLSPRRRDAEALLGGGAFGTPAKAARMPPSSGPNADAAAQTETATASDDLTDEWMKRRFLMERRQLLRSD